MKCETIAQLNRVSLKECSKCKELFYWLNNGLCKKCYKEECVHCDNCDKTVHIKNAINGVCKKCFVLAANRLTISHNVPGGILDNMGIYEIRDLLNFQVFPDDRVFPDDWNWSIMVKGKGEYVGSLAKRIGKFVFQSGKKKLSNDLLGKIGSIINAHTNKKTEYNFDFTGKFDWCSGDYGDSGSCYWGCHSGAKDLLQNNNCLAIRFYDEDKNGYARAWLQPIENGSYVLFNGYGEETINCARILADFLNLSYRKISIDNNGESGGQIWINGGMGYVVGKEEHINSFSCYDLGIEDEDQNICYHCGGICRDDYTVVNDNIVCEDCLSANYSYCESCDNYTSGDSQQVHHTDRQGRISERWVCSDCLSNYKECADCGEFFDNTVTACDRLGNEIEVCNDCAENYTSCEECSDLHKNINIVKDGRYEHCICDNCLSDNYVKCEDCGNYFPQEKIGSIGGKDYCPDCIDDHRADTQLELELNEVA